jgi:hypothetical protein
MHALTAEVKRLTLARTPDAAQLSRSEIEQLARVALQMVVAAREVPLTSADRAEIAREVTLEIQAQPSPDDDPEAASTHFVARHAGQLTPFDGPIADRLRDQLEEAVTAAGWQFHGERAYLELRVTYVADPNLDARPPQ